MLITACARQREIKLWYCYDSDAGFTVDLAHTFESSNEQTLGLQVDCVADGAKLVVLTQVPLTLEDNAKTISIFTIDTATGKRIDFDASSVSSRSRVVSLNSSRVDDKFAVRTDEGITVWDASAGHQNPVWSCVSDFRAISSLYFGITSGLILMGIDSGILFYNVYDPSNTRKTLFIETEESSLSSIRYISVATNQTLMAACTDWHVAIFELETWTQIVSWTAENESTYVEFSTDAERLLSHAKVSWTISLWKSRTGELLQNFSGRSVCWFPFANKIMVATSNGYIEAFDAETGAEVTRWIPHNHYDIACSVCPMATILM
jgi:hypothetical protein